MNRVNGKFEVPVAPLREAFERSDVSASELARRLGWMRPDTNRVQKQLGLRLDQDGKTQHPYQRETTSYQRAVEILEALGVDPVDVDL